jgi:hypothetical protein
LKAKNLPVPADLLQEIMAAGLDPNAGLNPNEFPGMDQGLNQMGMGDMMGGMEGGPASGPMGIEMPPEPGGLPPAAQPLSPTPGGMPEVSNERTPIQPPGGRSSMSKVIEEKDDRIIEKINLPKNSKKISLIREDVEPENPENKTDNTNE